MAVAMAAVAQPVAARQLTPDQSLERALANPQQGPKRVASAAARYKLLHTAVADRSNAPAFYVFGSGNTDGFVITTADDRLEPVIGICTGGTFTDIPENMKWWLEQYSAEISEYYAANPENVTASIVTPDDNYVNWAPIEPIVKAAWNQGAPYNDQCPTVNGQKTPTGCVATALAQVVRTIGYYNGDFSISYGNDNLGWSLSWNFGTYKPDFANMKDSYSGTNTAEEIKAVSDLMMACGIAVNSTYNVGSTGANFKLDNIKTYLGYTESFTVHRSGLSTAEWENLCYEILKSGKPMCYAGSGSGGHAFVCDGYSDNGMFHFNWGWGGYCNGYFRLSALNPAHQGIGGYEGGYSLGQNITVLATPKDNISLPNMRPGIVKWTGTQLKAPVVKGNVMAFEFMYSLTSLLFGSSLEVGVGLLLNNSSDGTEVVIKPDNYTQMWSNNTEYSFTLNVAGATLERGAHYDAYPVYFCKGHEGYWKIAPASGLVMGHYLLSVSDQGEISASVVEATDSGIDAFNMEANEFYSTDNKNQFKCLVVNHSENDFSEAMALRIVNPKTGETVLNISTSYLMLCSGETLPMEATFSTNDVQPGTYELILCRASSGTPLSEASRMAVEIKAGKRPESSDEKVPGPTDTSYQVAMWVDGKQQPMAPVSVIAGETYSGTTSVIASLSQQVEYSLALYNHNDLSSIIAKFPIEKGAVKGNGSWFKGKDFSINPGLGVGAYTMAFINQNEELVSYTADFLVGTEADGIVYHYDAGNDGLVAVDYKTEVATELQLPSVVESIPVVGVSDGAFAGCRQLEKLNLPASMKTIGINAFRGASSLRQVKFTAPDCPFANMAIGFHGVNPSAEFYVPSESFAAYNPAFNYRGILYASIKEISLPDSVDAVIGKHMDINAIVTPAEKINPKFMVEVSNPEALTATFDGKTLSINPLKSGVATVTVTSAEPYVEPAKVEVTVTPAPEVSIREISVDEKADYFDLSGRRLHTPRGIVIERRAGKATKRLSNR